MESSILVKTFALLEATAEKPAAKSLGELAASVGLSKPTAHRILKTLTALGYIERSRGGHYQQTGQVLRLITGANHRRLLEASDLFLRQLHASTQETVNLGALRQDKVVYLRVLESTLPLRRVVEQNTTDPFYCTALGRAIAAYLPTEQRKLLMRNSRLKKHTPDTVTDTDELMQILDQVAKKGYALEKDQTDIGVTCIGAPIFENNFPLAAISLSIPSARCSEAYEQRLATAVQSAAEKITQQLLICQEATQ